MRQEKFNFKEELRKYIDSERNILSILDKSYTNEDKFTSTRKEMINKRRAILDKLEQDYFSPFMGNMDNIKKFDEDGNLIKKENSTTEQVEEGLLKIFNALVEHGEFNIGDCDFNNEKYSTSLCQIADKLLQIDSDRNLREEYYKNCTID